MPKATLKLKTAVVIQSSYIPWKGFFDLVSNADVFVIYDTVQYSKNNFRNRNKIVIQGEPKWITIPVRVPSVSQTINQITIDSGYWARKHWSSIQQSYGKSKGFEQFGSIFEQLYTTASGMSRLTDVNELFLRALLDMMGISVEIHRAETYELPEDRVDRLIAICKQAGCDQYLSGPAAKNYLDPKTMTAAGINCRFFNYGHYRQYPQRTAKFEHHVSIIDLLLSVGADFPRYLRAN